MIRVLLADDQALVRAGFRMLLEASEDIRVVGEAANGGAAVALAAQLRPDVVLMDLRMPDVDGLTATKRISADPALDRVKVVVLTTFDDDEHVFGALRAGASGSWSRTWSRRNCCRPCGSWRAATRCSRRASPGR